MHVITRKRLNDFADKYPDTRNALASWYSVMKRMNFSSIEAVREFFPSADKVDNLTVFNIAGNRVRLVAAIHHNRHKVYIRSVLTHAEYDREAWKK
jgi:mRNA interferase HigB